jgi:hypothetical protein
MKERMLTMRFKGKQIFFNNSFSDCYFIQVGFTQQLNHLLLNHPHGRANRDFSIPSHDGAPFYIREIKAG